MFEQWIEGHVNLTAPIEIVKDREWSLVAKVSTADGVLWFKENRAGTVYEAALMQALHRWAPDRVLEPIAVDVERGWSLLPDGGPTIREAGAVDWPDLLSRFAQLQRDLSEHAAAMISLRVPDLRPANLAHLVDTLSVPQAVTDKLPAFRRQCEELADSPIPLSINHDDLHDGNVFTSGKFFDWGDASVAHPFGVLLVSLRVASDKLGVKEGDLVLAQLRDAYLEPWTDLAPREQLVRDVELAIEVTKASRALSWKRSLADATPEQIAELDDPVSGWLGELGEPNSV